MCGYVLSFVRGGSGGGMVNSVPMFVHGTYMYMYVCSLILPMSFNCPRVKIFPIGLA